MRLVRAETVEVEVTADGDEDAARKATQQVWTEGAFGIKPIEVELLAKRAVTTDQTPTEWSLDDLKQPRPPQRPEPGSQDETEVSEDPASAVDAELVEDRDPTEDRTAVP